MATYTDNYNLIKPTYAETADIVPLNNNFEKIDEVMHASQTSLAPAYDQTASYQPGDVVMYELNMYKCTGATSGAWDPSKWTRTTAAETGGGGSVDFDIYGEASGTAEASFSDGAEASLVECEIGIVPSQDLHGYSKPWAGGAGKNKIENTAISTTVNGVIFTVNNDGTVIADGKATGGNATIVICSNPDLEKGTSYILNGCPTGGGSSTYRLSYSNNVDSSYADNGNGVTFTEWTGTYNDRKLYLTIMNGCEVDNLEFKPMIRLSSVADDTFEPYSNICPISGHTDVTVTVASTSGGSGEDYTVSLGATYYGGKLDATTGELEVTWENIASYAGETLPGEWLSSLDEYTALGTPTTGAQVVYELATPQTFNLTPTQVLTLLGQNYVSHDGGGTISLVYIKKDSTIIPNPSDAEIPLTGLEISGKDFVITDARIPAPPTNNGAYVLTVTVTGGTPTYSWENA